MTQDDRMETITDPEQIHAVWEAGDMGDFPCRTTPVRVTEAGAVEYVPRTWCWTSRKPRRWTNRVAPSATAWQ